MTGALFDLPPDAREKRSNTPKWGGNASVKARAQCRALLKRGPVACTLCGVEITKDDPESIWDAGHLTDRVLGMGDHAVTPQHKACNRGSGGKIGAAITNARHQKPSMERVQVAQWW